MSTEKLSELSKPVAYDYQYAGAQTCEGFVDWRNELTHDCPPDWMVEDGKVTGVKPLYSQEYVSALLADNEYMRWRIKEMDLLFGKNLLAMRAAVIEAEHGEGHTAGMQWIFNTLFGPGEFAPENETDAQDYYNREAEKIDVEFSKVMEFYKQRREDEKERSNG